MNKTISTLTLVTLFSVILMTSCVNSSEKKENAKQNVTDANEALEKANQEYLADMENYRTEADKEFAANAQSLAEFKIRISNEKKEARADYEKKMDELNNKNSDMKKKMDDFKSESSDQWGIFKTEFSRDMDELGKAFQDLTVNNVKQ